MSKNLAKDFTRHPAENLEPLICDLVQWIAREPREYKDVMDAWKSHCPRLMIWEDAVDRGLVQRHYEKDNRCMVQVTRLGTDYLASHGKLAQGKH